MRLQYDGMEESVEGDKEAKANVAMKKVCRCGRERERVFILSLIIGCVFSVSVAQYTYYPCYKCGTAYFGGDAVCEAARGATDFDPTELVCPTCVGGATMQVREWS